MKKIILILGVVCAVVIGTVIIAGMYKFNYLASEPGYDVDGNKIVHVQDYEIIEVTGQSCQKELDCETPMEYAIQSSCPYDSLCINSACTVICPHPFSGAKIDVADLKNTTYTIDGTPVTLVDGLSETEAAPGSAAMVTTRYFGNEVETDLNNDGREDVAFLITQEAGGTGTFFYVVAALNTESGWVGSQGFFLGDRIAPQTTEMSKDDQNSIVVNYADREDGQAMSEPPSVGKSVWLKFDTETMSFGEVSP